MSRPHRLAPASIIGAVAYASWLVPTAVLALVALHESLPRALPPLLLVAASVSAGIGLVLGAAILGVTRRRTELSPSVRTNALVGALVSVFVLIMVTTADACGASAMREARLGLAGSTAAAIRDAPGWNGGATLGPTAIVVSSLDRRAQASKVIAHPFDRALRVMVVSVDNRAGDHEVVVDLETVRLRLAGGAVRTNVPHAELHVMRGEPSGSVAGPLRVPAGERSDRAQAFFAEDITFRDVEAVELRVDGATLVVPGRYFTLEEKRAIDSARPR